MENAALPNIHYYIGTEGSVILKPEKNGYLLTASYTDHGINNSDRLKGQDAVVILPK
jgi:hypothetical protein